MRLVALLRCAARRKTTDDKTCPWVLQWRPPTAAVFRDCGAF